MPNKSIHKNPAQLCIPALVFIFIFSATLFAQGAPPAPLPDNAAEADDVPGRAVARISILNGDVSVRRGDSGDYVAAALNAPLMVQDSVATAAGARAEVQFDSSNMIRIGQNSEVRFVEVEANRFQMQIARGTVTYHILRESNAQVELSTPQISVRPVHVGSYRVTVLDDGQSQITVRSGEAEIYTPRGAEPLHVGQTMLARGTVADPEFQVVAAIGYDEWDRWNDDRDRRLETSRSRQYVSPDIYGAEDLDAHGRWLNDPQYGNVWAPTVEPGWAPYRAGRWVWEDYYGWTWVASEPWGWAPYHYGSWYYGNVGWCWYPGPVYSRHFWRPAMVAFFGFGNGFGVGVGYGGFGFGNIGWVPLAPFERFHPWYGRGYYNGYGRGNVINNIHIVNNTNISNVYRNARVGNGITGINSRDFASGRFNNTMRVGQDQIRQAGLVRGQLPLAPSNAALRFSDRQTRAIPTGTANRQFFSRNAPAQVNRVPFAQQQRSFSGQGSIPNGAVNNGAVNGGFRQTGQGVVGGNSYTQGRTAVPQYQNNSGSNANFGSSNGRQVVGQGSGGGSSWRRFGDPNASMNPGSQGRTVAPQSQNNSSNSNWGRFGAPSRNNNSAPQVNAAPRQQYFNSTPQPNSGAYRGYDSSPSRNYSPSYSGRSQSLQIAPPIVRERNYSAPQRYSAPSYSAPQRSSAPSYSAPRYSAPSNRGGGGYSAPSRGGGSSAPSHSGGGGGHDSGGHHGR